MIQLLFALIVSVTGLALERGGCAEDPPQASNRRLSLCTPPVPCLCENGTTSRQTLAVTPPFIAGASTYTCENLEETLDCLARATHALGISDRNTCDKTTATLRTTDSSTANVGAWLSGFVDRFPKNCGYNVRIRGPLLRSTLLAMFESGAEPNCTPSMCTSASFFAFSAALKRLRDENKLSAEKFEQLAGFDSISWEYFNTLTRPDRLMIDFNLGSGRVISNSEIESCSQKNWPRRGDFVQLWRERGSGHSIVFEDYLYDAEGKILGLCYWSSNQSTNGYAKRCEETKTIVRMSVGRIEL